MQKIFLTKVKQNDHERYIGRADARLLARMARKTELNEVPDAQRPIDVKRLGQIADFVDKDGTLSTSIVIGTVDDRIKVYPVKDIKSDEDLYYTEFPITDEEVEKFQDSFDIMDGQHRVFSFLQDYCLLPDDVPFQLSFEMYITPILSERQIIFKDTNENQKPVSNNLLLWFRSQLGMLKDSEEKYYKIVSMLGCETASPLKGRIIMSSEKIVGGLKSDQLISLLNKAKIKESINTQKQTDENYFNIIVAYLAGWEKAVDSKFVEREPAVGAFSKISGLRYMINLLPSYFDLAINSCEKFTSDFVAKKIKEFFALEGITPREFFDMSSEYNLNTQFNPFSSENNTNVLVADHKQKIRGMATHVFDPMA